MRNGNGEHLVNSAGLCLEGLGYVATQCSDNFCTKCILRLSYSFHKLESQNLLLEFY